MFFVFFGLDLEKTKKTQALLVFWITWWLKKCEKQKNSRFFGFSLRSQKETKATNTQKPRQNQKKPNMSLRPNILWKVLVFWFFGFLEVFLILSIELSQRVSKYCFLLVFSTFFVFLGFPHGFSPKESSNIVFLFPTCFDSVHSYYPQDILRNNWLLYIYAHKYIIYTYIHVETIYQNALR